MTDKKKKPLQTPDQLGKLQPQAVEIEEAILGAALLEQESFFTISAILKPSHFYKEQNALTYQAMLDLSKRGEPIDQYTVVVELKKKGELEIVGGSYYILTLTDKVKNSANIETHARIVIQKAMLRECILIGTQMIHKAYDDSTDCFDLIDWSGNAISGILNGIENNKAERIDLIKDEVVNDCKEAIINPKNDSGIPISIETMQQHLNGWRPGQFTVLAARPGMGKTAVALDYAIYPALQGIPTAMFSMEMPKKELAGRLMSKYSHITSSKIVNNMVDSDQLTAIIKDNKILDGVPFYIDDTPSLSITRLRSKAYRLVQLYGIRLIIIDYLQLMDGDGSGNREQEISQISRGIKKLSRELEIPIIALSQLSRTVENRPGANKRPQLSDLRESGAIEQDADMVIFLYRPEYYGIDVYTHGNEEMNNTRNLLLQIIAKYRQGAIADIRTKWHGSTTSISNWDRVSEELKPPTGTPPQNFYEKKEDDDLPF